MNRTFTSLLFKFILTFVAAWLAFSLFDDMAISTIFTIALAGTILNYILGDLFVLPNFGNIVAALGDGGLAALTAYAISMYSYNFTTATPIIVFAVFVSIAEYFFHIYLLRSDKVAPNVRDEMTRRPNLNMEAGSEFEFDNNNLNNNVNDEVNNNSFNSPTTDDTNKEK